MPSAKTMLAAVQATDKQLIAPLYLTQISANAAFSSLAQTDGSHWRPSPDYMVDVVTLLTRNSQWCVSGERMGKILHRLTVFYAHVTSTQL